MACGRDLPGQKGLGGARRTAARSHRVRPRASGRPSSAPSRPGHRHGTCPHRWSFRLSRPPRERTRCRVLPEPCAVSGWHRRPCHQLPNLPNPPSAVRRGTVRSSCGPARAGSRRRCPHQVRLPGSSTGRTSRSAGCTAPGPPTRVPARVDEVAATWAFSILPAVPCTGAGRRRCGALIHIAGLVDDQHRGIVVKALDDVFPHVITHGVSVPTARDSRCCMPCGLLSPTHSEMVQHFLRGRSDSSPSTNRRARRRGSCTDHAGQTVPGVDIEPHTDREHRVQVARHLDHPGSASTLSS